MGKIMRFAIAAKPLNEALEPSLSRCFLEHSADLQMKAERAGAKCCIIPAIYDPSSARFATMKAPVYGGAKGSVLLEPGWKLFLTAQSRDARDGRDVPKTGQPAIVYIADFEKAAFDGFLQRNKLLLRTIDEEGVIVEFGPVPKRGKDPVLLFSVLEA